MRRLPLRGVVAVLGALALVCSACAGDTAPPTADEAPTSTADQAPTTVPPEETEASNGEPQAPAEVRDGETDAPAEAPVDRVPTEEATTQADLDPIGTYAALLASELNNCFATEGTDACWGLFGQTDVPAGAYKVVSAGWYHSCAIAVDGSIDCWGHDGWRQAGAPTGAYKVVSAGLAHSCAIAADDRIVCWGDNDATQGDAPTGAYKVVSAGLAHSCAIAADDTVVCWGYNASGQADAPAGIYRALSAGGSHNCAIAADGTIVCWGDDRYGKTLAPEGTHRAVSTSSTHSCAIAADGTLACWGHNEFGQADAPAGTYRAVAAGEGHSCAVASDGTVTCWGHNELGQADPPEGAYQAVAAGEYYSCAIAVDGTVACWGSVLPSEGIRRTGDAEPGETAATASNPSDQAPSGTGVVADAGSPAHTFKAVSAGERHDCAITADGTIACWGLNESGQLDAPEGTFKAIDVGTRHSCAIAADDTLACWGLDEFGQSDAPAGAYKAVSAGWGRSCAIATDNTLACWGHNLAGQSDAPAGAYKAVSAGGGHSCAVAADDTIVCWGSNDLGQADPPAGAHKTVVAGLDHSCAIATDDTLACWGHNAAGQSAAPAGTYKFVAAGAGHSCAVAAAGTLVCWGSNDLGQADAPAGSYSAVTAGNDHSCAVATDGAITCWGLVPPPDGARWVSPDGPRYGTGEDRAWSGQGQPVSLPGEGVDVVAGRADWYHGYFQAALHKLLLEELGYEVTDPAQLELGPNLAYTAMAEGDMDYWPNSWYPGHYSWHSAVLPDGSLVGDHVSVVGEMLYEGALQGFLVTKPFADTYGVYTMDALNRNTEALAAFDAADPVPGNGKADIFGCRQSWTCDDIVQNMIAFSGWDNIAQITGDYDVMFAQAVRRANSGVPTVIYMWTPSPYITELRPGDNVYWMGVENVLDDSNPTGFEGGEEFGQRGPDGTGGFVSIGPEQCPSAARRPDSKCPIGWRAAHVLVTANTGFLEANPAARALLEAVKLNVVEVSVAAEMVRVGTDPDDLAAQWVTDNRDRVESWLAVARAAR